MNRHMMYSPTLRRISKKIVFLHTCMIIIVITSLIEDGFVAGFVPFASFRKVSLFMLKLLKFIVDAFVFGVFDAFRPTADFLRADMSSNL